MFVTYTKLVGDKVVVQLKNDDVVVEGFDYAIAADRKGDWEAVAKMVEREAKRRNREQKHKGNHG